MIVIKCKSLTDFLKYFLEILHLFFTQPEKTQNLIILEMFQMYCSYMQHTIFLQFMNKSKTARLQ